MTNETRYDAYLAGPWFSPEQVLRITEARAKLSAACVSYYDPQSMCLCPPNAADDFASYVLSENLRQIEAASFVYACITGRDLGTVFEVGYAYAKSKPVLYDQGCADAMVLVATDFDSLVMQSSYIDNMQKLVVVCDTAGKDPQQVAMAGYAVAKGCRVIYYCEGLPAGASVNLMLAKSGIAVCTESDDLDEVLKLAVADSSWGRAYSGRPIE